MTDVHAVAPVVLPLPGAAAARRPTPPAAPAADGADDPMPVRPAEPADDACCGEGCIHCAYDRYDEAVERYRVALAQWQARHP